MLSILGAMWGPLEGAGSETTPTVPTRTDGEIQTQGCSLPQRSHAELSSAVQPFLSPILYTDLAVTSWEQYPENEVRIFNQGSCCRQKGTLNKARQTGGWAMHQEREEAGPMRSARSHRAGKFCEQPGPSPELSKAESTYCPSVLVLIRCTEGLTSTQGR